MLLEAFLERCAEAPEALAVTDSGREFSYGELLVTAAGVARALKQLGAGPATRVAICLDRGIDAVIAVFGVLLAGACYVPLDVRSPPGRLRYIAEDATVGAAIGVGEPPGWLNASSWLDLRKVSAVSDFDLPAAFASDQAVILYTSGSTGSPKGVALSHGAVSAFASWAARLVLLQPEDRVASSAPFFFDLSTFDLYAVLGAGASLHFIPYGLTLAPARLTAWLGEQSIGGWYTVPSLLAFLAYKGNLPQTPLEALRFVIFAGEVFAPPALMALARALPAARLYNFFGPTETNVCCYWEVERNRLRPDETIPIGSPAAGDEVRIVDGQLWVRGPTLASGYWAQGRLRPLCDPVGWYATGDRVSLGLAGELLYHGRMGRMLKCSGYRVEPAEIEQAVLGVDGVRACAVVGVDDPAAGQRPALALCLETPSVLAKVRIMLKQELPSYMQPVRWLQLEELPLLPTGKVDYRRLQTLVAES